MELIFILTCLSTFVYSIVKRKYKKSLLSLFCGLWLIIGVLYYLRLYGVYSSNEHTFFIYSLGVLFFFLGYIFYPQNNITNVTGSRKRIKGNLILKILAIISLFVYIRKSIVAIPILLAGGAGALKNAIISEGLLDIGLWGEIIYTFIARPVQIVIVIYSIICMFQNKKDFVLYSLTVLMLVLGYICSASKFLIIEIATMAFTYILFFGSNGLIQSLKQHKWLSLIVITVLIVITYLLDSKGEGFAPSLYSYLCGCIPCSNNAIKSIDSHDYFYGLVTFNGVLRVICLPFSELGLINVKGYLEDAYSFMMQFEDTVYIAPSIPYNAFISQFSYFYADFGYIGVCGISFLFGLISALAFNKTITNPSYRNASIVMYFSLIISTSMIRAQTFLVPYAMAFVYILFLIPTDNIEINSKKS